MFYYTRAPVDYDYGYTIEVKADILDKENRPWRIVKITCPWTLNRVDYQRKRYLSGSYVSHAVNGKDSYYEGLPEVELRYRVFLDPQDGEPLDCTSVEQAIKTAKDYGLDPGQSIEYVCL